jgi:hypothetical protein
MNEKKGDFKVVFWESNKFCSTERVVIFVSAVIYNEAQENPAALSHIQLCVPL